MSLKQRLILLYVVIGLCFALYQNFFVPMSYKGLAYNLGGAVFWPVTVFPSLGAILGSLIILVFVVLVLALG